MSGTLEDVFCFHQKGAHQCVGSISMFHCRQIHLYFQYKWNYLLETKLEFFNIKLLAHMCTAIYSTWIHQSHQSMLPWLITENAMLFGV